MQSRRRFLLQALGAVLAAMPLQPAVAARRRVVHHRRHRHRHRPAPKPLVVIDPGHGGKDPGCIGIGGTQEKTVVLALGLALARELRASGRFRVAMTRHTDVFIPLLQRVRYARARRAALFISLHANASRDHHACGACVYRFAYRASDAPAAAMARWENRDAAEGGPAFDHASPIVVHILASLMRRETWLHSARLQDCFVDSLVPCQAGSPVAARHAHFVVLSAPDIASVLVESGFLTNAAEERRLRDPRHRRALALAMRHGVERYFER
jgi:N-acetylmuramoyl-L-alanine amidase